MNAWAARPRLVGRSVTALEASDTKRSPKADVIDTVRFSQARALRIRHNHWRKLHMLPPLLDDAESDSAEADELLLLALQASSIDTTFDEDWWSGRSFKRISKDLQRAFEGVSKDLPKDFKGLSKDFQRTFKGLSKDFQRTF